MKECRPASSFNIISKSGRQALVAAYSEQAGMDQRAGRAMRGEDEWLW